MFLCAVIGAANGYFVMPQSGSASDKDRNETEIENEFLFGAAEDVPDLVLEYFRDIEYRDWVTEFFASICSNRDIAEAILYNCNNNNVSPSLAFALCWEESRFNPNAVNRHNRDGSIDRGLFQLNSNSFPNLDNSAFFNIYANSRNAIEHLRQCMDLGGSEISALAMYNAGEGRVKSTGTPHVTLNYISRILENRARIDRRFHSRLISEEEARLQKNEQ
ncbi:MAG: lytic transglycosylase domain-containing protein [Treponema sp.]|nr:lytic transglycosylase domain-containing protein [Treponema sp.]